MSPNPDEDRAVDSALIARWKAGDQAAATALVERHAAALARFAASTGERERVDELVQDTFVRAFNAIDSFRDDAAFRTWLFTILKRLVLDRRRADRRQGGVVELEEGHAVQAYDALDALVADETAQRVRAAVAKLSPLQREVFLLRVNDGVAYTEIATVVGSTEGACRVHYHNAVRTIMELLDDDA